MSSNYYIHLIKQEIKEIIKKQKRDKWWPERHDLWIKTLRGYINNIKAKQ